MKDDRTTNNPWQDNWERAHRKRLRETVKWVRIHNTDGTRLPRKRKKFVNSVERKHFAELIEGVFRGKIENEKNYFLVFPVKK